MSEEITESKAEAPEAADEKAVELVDYEANAGYPHKVYPEIKEFFESRKRAEWIYKAARSARHAERAAFIAEERRKFYADETNMGGEFDEYHITRQWDRAHLFEDGTDPEHVRSDFIAVGARLPAGRRNMNNPNSWDELYKATTHPEVKWIIDNCLGSPSEALIILGYLPATMNELWSFAKDRHGMCDTFDRYMQQAEASGLFEGGDRAAGVKELLALQSYVRRAYGRAYVSELSVHVTRLMKAMREDAAAQVAEAKAEWQKLDEARAENATFNRSRAQLARYERERAQVKAALLDVGAAAGVTDEASDVGASEPAVSISEPLALSARLRVVTVDA